jgi:hypothetical protein
MLDYEPEERREIEPPRRRLLIVSVREFRTRFSIPNLTSRASSPMRIIFHSSALSRGRIDATGQEADCVEQNPDGTRRLAPRRLPGAVLRQIVVWNVKRRHVIDVLAFGTQRLSACSKDGCSRAHAYEGLGELSCRIDQMLAIIEHQKKSLSADRLRDRAGGNLAPQLLAETGRYGRRNETGIRERSELYQHGVTLKSRGKTFKR